MDFTTLKKFGVGCRLPEDELFEMGDKYCRMYAREGIVEIDEEQLCHNLIKTFSCHVPTCLQQFTTILDYEVHYNSCHRFICAECKKPLPSPHLLDLHLSESHDSFFAAQAAKKPMYTCFVEGCPIKSVNGEERRSHCIEIHKFPHDFRFDQSLKKQKKAPSKKKNENQDIMEKEEHENKVTLKKTFTFGHGKQGKAFSQHKSSCNSGDNKQSFNLDDLMETLPME